jgi:ATP-dependent helicase HrpA
MRFFAFARSQYPYQWFLMSSIQVSLEQCMSSHRHKLSVQLKKVRRLPEKERAEALDKVRHDVDVSVALAKERQHKIPTFEYPDLPVSERADDIADAISNHQVVIIAGETGSGKTTQIPKICLQVGRGVKGLIGHTQPRRLAARSVATRIAQELDSEIGQHVGFKVRFSDQVSDSSYIKLMTDGILLAEIQRDRFLNDYDTIIIDEAHERSLNIDFILGYLKQLLPKRPDLKLIITSATIDPERFSVHFNQAPIIQVSGRTYPVEMRYRPLLKDGDEDDIDQIQGIVDAVNELSRLGKGDILVFLSGEREIRDTEQALNRCQFSHTEVVPLYARLSSSEQNRIFQSHSGRRIVLATNVAETSLTVPGIKYVIDPGTARISRYSPRSKVQRLPIESISQASANQRAGRCGRVSSGVCIRLYSEEDYLGRPEFTDPEILRTNLASVILQMLALGLGDMQAFPFVQAPDGRQINDGFKLLEELSAIEKNQHKARLTPLGRQLARLPVDPRYARMVIEAHRQQSLSEVIVITAALSIQDPRERPQEKRQVADQAHAEYADKESDFLSFYNLWQLFKEKQNELTNNQLRKWCHQHFINYLRMREWQDIVSQLKRSIVELGFRLNSDVGNYDNIHIAIASGLLSQIGTKDNRQEYLGARNTRFMIFPGSGIAKQSPKWMMTAELVETSKLFARVGAKIQPQWLEPLASHLTKTRYDEPHWSKKRGTVQAYQTVTLYGLSIITRRLVDYGRVDPQACHALFIQEALVGGQTKLNYAFLRHNQKLVEDVVEQENQSRRRDILVDEEELVSFYQEHLPEHVVSESTFKKWWRDKSKSQPTLLTFSTEQLTKTGNKVSALDFPKTWQQSNLTLPLSYEFEPTVEDDGVSLLIPLPLLNQVQNVGFDWLIPGFRHELIVSLIKSLPKSLRRNFVPAPNYADACLADLNDPTQPFIEAITHKLHRMTGVKVPEDEWKYNNLAKHLSFNFKVLDKQKKVIAQGRDLPRLKQKLSDKMSETIKSAAESSIERKGIQDWDFEPLPKEFIEKQSGFDVKAYPALVDDKTSVSIGLFDTPEKAQRENQLGLRRLVLMNIPSPVSYLQKQLPNKAKLGLYFNPFGQIKKLIDDCIHAATDELMNEFGSEMMNKERFDKLRDFVRTELNERVLDIAQKVEVGLTTAHGIHKKMKGSVPLNMINAHGDIKSHVESLVFEGFVTELGVDKLDDWNRYIKGIARRLEKLAIDPSKDRVHQLSIEKVTAAYKAKMSKVPVGQTPSGDLLNIRWMIDELRVSYFAQQLGTSGPISEKRIINALAEL